MKLERKNSLSLSLSAPRVVLVLSKTSSSSCFLSCCKNTVPKYKEKENNNKRKEGWKERDIRELLFSLPLFFINGMNGLKIVMARKEEREERLIRESLDVCFRVEEEG